MPFIKKHIGYIAAFSVMAAILAVLIIAVVNEIRIANSDSSFGHKVIVATPQSNSSQPASSVAKALHCSRYRQIPVGTGVKGFVLDEGSCYIGGIKYAIDTFQSVITRDSWLKMSEPLGVVPAFETSTSVTYKSVNG